MQAAFKHVASICKRTSFEFKKQFLFRAHTPLQRRRAVRRSKFSRCSLITYRLAREVPTARQGWGCVRTPSKQARNTLMFNNTLRCRSYLGLFTRLWSMILAVISRELCKNKNSTLSILWSFKNVKNMKTVQMFQFNCLSKDDLWMLG